VFFTRASSAKLVTFYADTEKLKKICCCEGFFPVEMVNGKVSFFTRRCAIANVFERLLFAETSGIESTKHCVTLKPLPGNTLPTTALKGAGNRQIFLQ
jgi:hypothetical protein